MLQPLRPSTQGVRRSLSPRQALRFSTYPKRKGFAKANTAFTAGERAKDPRKFMVNQLSPGPFPPLLQTSLCPYLGNLNEYNAALAKRTAPSVVFSHSNKGGEAYHLPRALLRGSPCYGTHSAQKSSILIQLQEVKAHRDRTE